MKTAFSIPTRDEAERQTLFRRYHSSGYAGLQLKYNQYREYLDQPTRFQDQWGTDASAIASGLIAGGLLDEQGVAELRRLFRFAQVVGSERIIFCHGQLRQGLSPADIRGFAKLLSELGQEAEQHGTALSLHHHYNQPVMYRQDFTTFFDAVVDRSVRLTIDTAHLVKSGIHDIAEVFRTYAYFIDNIHIKDLANSEFKLIGQGEIDFGPVFAALKEIRYDGWYCLDEESDSNLVEAMQVGAQFLASQGE